MTRSARTAAGLVDRGASPTAAREGGIPTLRRAHRIAMLAAACLALAACGGGTSQAPVAADPGVAGGVASLPAQPAPVEATQAPAEPVTPAPAATAAAAAGPIDACALLTADEVAGLVTDATPTAENDESGQIPTYTCRWDAAISDGMIPASIAVTVMPGFVSGSGATPEFIAMAIQAEGNDPANNGGVVDGLGDVGVVTSIVKFDAEAKFLDGDNLVMVTLTRDDAPSQQDAVVELARAVEGRIP